MSLSDRTLSHKARSDFSSSHASSLSLSISDNVRLMQDSLQLLFSERDRLSIVQILEDFHRDRDVALFVENLRPYIDSPVKVQHFLPCLRRVFPRTELATLDARLREIGVTADDRPESRALTAALPDDAPSSLDSSTLTRSTFEPDPSDLAPYRPPAARYSWVDRQGRSVSPPAAPPVHRAAGLLLFALRVPPGSSLGVSVRGGAEFGLGVFVAAVDAGSAAALAGLTVGDQVVRVNGRDTAAARHDDVVRLLHRHAARLEVEVWRVGRLPFAKKAGPEGRVIDQFQLFSAGSLGREGGGRRDRSGETTDGREGGGRRDRSGETTDGGRRDRSGDEEGALGRLSGQERQTLAYYMDEYREATISVDDLVLAVSQMSAGRHGFDELVRLLRGWIRAADVDRYTLLTSLHDELTAQRVRKEENTAQRRKSTPRECAPAVSDLRTRSPALEKRRAVSDKSQRAAVRSSSTATEVRLHRAIQDIEETGLSDDSGVDSAGQRRQKWSPRVQDAGVCTEPRQQRDAGTLTEEEPVRDGQRVRVDKAVSGHLGMSVEGGAGSKQPLPRIINVQPGGAAEATGRLRVGQTILEVNGVSLEGVTHHDAAQMIARAFRNPDQPTMELMVMDPGKDKS